MFKRLNSAQRPPSRLDNNKKQFQSVYAAGIPQRLISAYRPFPPIDNLQKEEQDKENRVLYAPKKQQKNKSTRQTNNGHVFRRKAYSDIESVFKNIDNKAQSLKKQQKQKLPFFQEVAFNQSLLFKDQQEVKNQQLKKGHRRLGDQCKSAARRVRERIQAQNAKREQQKKKRKSIGQEAYIPYTLKQLKQRIILKGIKNT